MNGRVLSVIIVISLGIVGYFLQYETIEILMADRFYAGGNLTSSESQQTNVTATFNKTLKLESGFLEPTETQSLDFSTVGMPLKDVTQGSEARPQRFSPRHRQQSRQDRLQSRQPIQPRQDLLQSRQPLQPRQDHPQPQQRLSQLRQDRLQSGTKAVTPSRRQSNLKRSQHTSSEAESHPMCDASCRWYIPLSHDGQQNQTEDYTDSCQSAVLKAASDYESFHSQTHERWLHLCSTNTTDTTNITDTAGLHPFCKSVKFLGFVCAPYADNCHGMADRMKNIVSLYYLAILSNRILLLRMDKNWEIRDYLEPNRINWDYRDWPNLPYELKQKLFNWEKTVVRNGYKPYREDEYYGCTRPPLKPTTLTCWSVLLTSQFVTGGTRIFEDPFDAIAPGACGPNVHSLSSLFERQSIRAGAISSVFKLSEIVQNKVAELKKQVGDPENCIMIHSRTIELHNLDSDRRHRPKHVTGAQQERFLLAEKLNKKYNKTFKWILVADEDEVKQQEKKLYPDIVTFDTTPIHTNTKGNEVGTKFSGAKLDSLVDTIAEFYMLGYCNILIRGISGFSNAAEWIHGVEKVQDREVYEFLGGR